MTRLISTGYNTSADGFRHSGCAEVSDRAAWFHGVISGNSRGLIPTAVRSGLWWARLPYGSAVAVRNLLFDRGIKPAIRVGVPVVSIGNLTLGGTGKTPCVEYVARYYRELGRQAAILSRGYGVEAGRNDEAMVLEENLPDVPHLQGRDRAALAVAAMEELESDLLVLDDGFQHRRLARDLDIVLVDATQPIDRDYLFPRGTLREPVSSLRRANTILLTRCDQAEPNDLDRMRTRFRSRFPNTVLAECDHAPLELIRAETDSVPITTLQGQRVGGFCGIGNPTAFRQTLESLGTELAAFRTFPDHHAYSRADVEDLTRWANTLPTGSWLVTTQKDLVKLRIPDLAGIPLYALRIGMKFRDGEDRFRRQLEAVVAAVGE